MTKLQTVLFFRPSSGTSPGAQLFPNLVTSNTLHLLLARLFLASTVLAGGKVESAKTYGAIAAVLARLLGARGRRRQWHDDAGGSDRVLVLLQLRPSCSSDRSRLRRSIERQAGGRCQVGTRGSGNVPRSSSLGVAQSLLLLLLLLQLLPRLGYPVDNGTIRLGAEYAIVVPTKRALALSFNHPSRSTFIVEQMFAKLQQADSVAWYKLRGSESTVSRNEKNTEAFRAHGRSVEPRSFGVLPYSQR